MRNKKGGLLKGKQKPMCEIQTVLSNPIRGGVETVVKYIYPVIL